MLTSTTLSVLYEHLVATGHIPRASDGAGIRLGILAWLDIARMNVRQSFAPPSLIMHSGWGRQEWKHLIDPINELDT